MNAAPRREGRVVNAPPRRGASVPLLAVGAVLLLFFLLAFVVDLDAAVVPNPKFRELALKGYPYDIAPEDAARIVEATLWWLCLSFVLWVAGLAALALCWYELRRATRHDAALARSTARWFAATIAVAVAALLGVVVLRKTPLMSFSRLLDNLDMMSPGFIWFANLNTALVVVVGLALLIGLWRLLLPGAHDDDTMEQVEAITRLMYAGAAFALVWISAATAMYRLAAVLLVANWREPALKLAPTISLMGGLFLSLLLVTAYLSACALLQHWHEQSKADGDGPKAFLAAHWPKLIAILMPLLPGAAVSVLQVMTQAP